MYGAATVSRRSVRRRRRLRDREPFPPRHTSLGCRYCEQSESIPQRTIVSLQVSTSLYKRGAGSRAHSRQTVASSCLNTRPDAFLSRPANGLNHTLIKGHTGPPAQNGARFQDVGFRVPLFARPRRLVKDLIIGSRAFKGGQHQIGKPVDGKTSTAQIERMSVAGGILQSPRPRFHYIRDIYEIPRLLAIAENRYRLAPDHIPDEDPQNSLVGIIQRLAWSINVVHSKRSYAKIEVQVRTFRSRVHVTLAGVLGDSVIGDRLARRVFGCRQDTIASVSRHRNRVKKTWHVVA